MKSEDSGLWHWILAFGILGTALGFLLLFSPILSEIIISYSLAFMLIFYGFNNMIIFFRLKKIGNHIKDYFGKLS